MKRLFSRLKLFVRHSRESGNLVPLTGYFEPLKRYDEKGQVTTEYVLATGIFLVIFVWFHGVIQEALRKLFASAAFIILTSWR